MRREPGAYAARLHYGAASQLRIRRRYAAGWLVLVLLTDSGGWKRPGYRQTPLCGEACHSERWQCAVCQHCPAVRSKLWSANSMTGQSDRIIPDAVPQPIDTDRRC
jgi:hypothetical protein